MSFNHQQHPEHTTLPIESQDDDYEIITSEEVDGVLDALEQLIAATTSENIRTYLEEAADNIFSLVYSEDDQSEAAEHDEAA
ncbi:hypothetical protein SH661x_003582 [Planctomicrobium sp. SH661]|uniref:hypothetical protein n=1 Tax=Planctomicrobium sp. SH661 TaxID=3448124 RepID=UPI003F5BFCE3